LRNMDYPSNSPLNKLDDLVEKYGFNPQDIPLSAWHSVFDDPDRAEYYHKYYSYKSTQKYVDNGLMLGMHPLMYIHKMRDKRKAQANFKKELLSAIFPDERHVQSEQPPSS
jgi:hypothetical protein